MTKTGHQFGVLRRGLVARLLADQNWHRKVTNEFSRDVISYGNAKMLTIAWRPFIETGRLKHEG